MQSNEIVDFINKFNSIKNKFIGVCSITTIPFIKIDHFVIINTDPHYNPGKHWFCLIRRKKYFELFDSLGISEEKLANVNEFLNLKKNVTFKYNETVLQSHESISCGKFVLYFVIHRYHNFDLSFQSVLDESFDVNPEINENFVESFYKTFK